METIEIDHNDEILIISYEIWEGEEESNIPGSRKQVRIDSIEDMYGNDRVDVEGDFEEMILLMRC